MLKQKKYNRLKLGGLLLVVLILIVIAVSCHNRQEVPPETTVLQTEAETTHFVEETTAAPSESPETEPETEPAVVIELPDKENLVGRLIIEDLGLDDYVMLGDEYLEKDNDGNNALQGSLYIPGYSTEDCIFINGHTMKDGSRFGNLYKQRDRLVGMKVRLQDEASETEYQIVKTYIVSGTDPHVINALYNDEYKSYLEEYQELDVTGTVLSMMCCEYSQNNGRLFVVATEASIEGSTEVP